MNPPSAPWNEETLPKEFMFLRQVNYTGVHAVVGYSASGVTLGNGKPVSYESLFQFWRVVSIGGREMKDALCGV